MFLLYLGMLSVKQMEGFKKRGSMDETKLKDRKAMLTALFEDKAYVPMKAKELAMLLNIPKSQRGELQEVLDILVAEGKAGLSKKGKYGKPETFSVQGMFSGHPRGFGFVTIEGRDRSATGMGHG